MGQFQTLEISFLTERVWIGRGVNAPRSPTTGPPLCGAQWDLLLGGLLLLLPFLGPLARSVHLVVEFLLALVLAEEDVGRGALLEYKVIQLEKSRAGYLPPKEYSLGIF